MAEPIERQRSPRIRSYLIGGFAMMLIVSCIVVGYQVWMTREQAIRDGEQNSIRLARTLADHTELTFLSVDMLIRRAIERQYFNSLFGNNLPEYTAQNFKIWLGETPQVVAMALIGDDGDIDVAAHKTGYEHWLDYHKTLIGQQLFDHMKEADDTSVFIGKHSSEESGSLILVARRYNKLDDSFGGIIVAAIDPSYFIEFYDSIASGNEKFMTLLMQDGTNLVSEFPNADQDAPYAQNFFAERPDAEQAQSELATTPDRTLKIVALKKLKHLPVTAAIVLDSSDFLSTWRQLCMKDIGFLTLFIVFGSILSFFAMAMARQITRIEESEGAAILASQAKSEFLANMSHELRTPLNAIIGFSEMINSGYFGPLNSKQKERIHDINLCGSHLLQLISDILEFSKGEAGKLELFEEKVDLADIINEGVRIMNGKIKTKGLHLVVAVEADLSCLWGDKRKIRQVLINLLSNALKFTMEGGTVTVAARLDPQGNMHLTVSDTGIGISDSDIPKALSVFGQVNRNKSHEGTGLGLPLCKMYAELHDGKLQITSKMGEGTTVRVIFPHQRVLPKKSG